MRFSANFSENCCEADSGRPWASKGEIQNRASLLVQLSLLRKFVKLSFLKAKSKIHLGCVGYTSGRILLVPIKSLVWFSASCLLSLERGAKHQKNTLVLWLGGWCTHIPYRLYTKQACVTRNDPNIIRRNNLICSDWSQCEEVLRNIFILGWQKLPF